MLGWFTTFNTHFHTLERISFNYSGCYGHAGVAMQGLGGKTCPRQAWAWHPTRNTYARCGLNEYEINCNLW
jgi:hypothetical protein